MGLVQQVLDGEEQELLFLLDVPGAARALLVWGFQASWLPGKVTFRMA